MRAARDAVQPSEPLRATRLTRVMQALVAHQRHVGLTDEEPGFSLDRCTSVPVVFRQSRAALAALFDSKGENGNPLDNLHLINYMHDQADEVMRLEKANCWDSPFKFFHGNGESHAPLMGNTQVRPL